MRNRRTLAGLHASLGPKYAQCARDPWTTRQFRGSGRVTGPSPTSVPTYVAEQTRHGPLHDRHKKWVSGLSALRALAVEERA
jgi:hypothetical protein